MELLEVPPSTRAGKNGADMRMVIDALELCYARDYIDAFVIGSGDSDFCPLAYKLRENNRLVIGLGVKESTSRLFVKACDEFIYLRPHSATKGAKEKNREEGGARRRKPKAAEEGAGKSKKRQPERPPAEIPQIAQQVVSSLLARATGPINPSLIKETIVRQQPDFDEREHGFSTFSKLLERMGQESLLRRQQGRGRQWYVVAFDAASAPDSDEPGAERLEAQQELPLTDPDGDDVPF